MLLILLWHSPSCQCEVGCMWQPWCYYYCSVIPPDVNIRSAACEHIDAFNTALSFHLTSVWGRLYVTTLMLLLLLCRSTWCQCEVGCMWQPWCFYYCSVIPPDVNVRSAVCDNLDAIFTALSFHLMSMWGRLCVKKMQDQHQSRRKQYKSKRRPKRSPRKSILLIQASRSIQTKNAVIVIGHNSLMLVLDFPSMPRKDIHLTADLSSRQKGENNL